MKRITILVATASMLVACYTGPTYTKPGMDGDKQAMEQAMAKCEAQGQATCSRGESYPYCVKATAKKCMQEEGWTEK